MEWTFLTVETFTTTLCLLVQTGARTVLYGRHLQKAAIVIARHSTHICEFQTEHFGGQLRGQLTEGDI
jgi:hypothetical protein